MILFFGYDGAIKPKERICLWQNSVPNAALRWKITRGSARTAAHRAKRSKHSLSPPFSPLLSLSLSPLLSLSLSPRLNLSLSPRLNLSLSPRLNLPLSPHLNLPLSLNIGPPAGLLLNRPPSSTVTSISSPLLPLPTETARILPPLQRTARPDSLSSCLLSLRC